MDNIVTFRVIFDPEAWSTMTDEERLSWVDRVTDVLNDEVYVSGIHMGPEATA